jgi:hypothetical protein
MSPISTTTAAKANMYRNSQFLPYRWLAARRGSNDEQPFEFPVQIGSTIALVCLLRSLRRWTAPAATRGVKTTKPTDIGRLRPKLACG